MEQTGTPSSSTRIVPVCRRPAFTIGLEEYQGYCFVHCFVHKPLTPPTWRQLQADWQVVADMQGRDIFALAMVPDRGDVEKHRKFVTKFGFEPHIPFVCTDGVERTIYRRKYQHG